MSSPNFSLNLLKYGCVKPFVKNKKFIDDMNCYLKYCNIFDFCDYVKKNNFLSCFYVDLQFSIITLYDILNFRQEHCRDIICMLQKNYFEDVYKLIPLIDEKFLLYSEYVQLMFNYMLVSDCNIFNCMKQLTGNYVTFYVDFDSNQFLKHINQMIKYCKNNEIKQLVQNKIIDRIVQMQNQKINYDCFVFDRRKNDLVN